MEFSILHAEQVVATISVNAEGPHLSYTSDWLRDPERFAASLTMPLGTEVFGPQTLLPWLMNLLPEGEPLRAMTRVLGAASDDVIGLITRTGADLAGALSIAPRITEGIEGYRVVPDAGALERIINDLPARPFLADEDGVAMSLAGAQDKLPVSLVDGMIAIPVNGAASTHILKPDNPRLLGSVQNEALCMVLARRAGLNTAPVVTGGAGRRSYLLVTRYDREGEGASVRRLHQEDFCQALGRPPSAKYEFNGTGTRGPSVADFFALVREHMTAREITQLLDAVIFNIAIGNVDSHAKNYSALLTGGGTRFAPLYDLMSGLAWGNITQNHAQAIGGQRRGRHIYERHWRRMAEASGLAATGTVRRVEQMTARLLKELPDACEEVAAMPAGAGSMLAVFRAEIATRIAEVHAHCRETGDDAPLGEDADPQVSGAATAYHG